MARLLAPSRDVLTAYVALLSSALLVGCTVDTAPSSARSSQGEGPVVRHQLYPEDLTRLPLPNDLLTLPDPTTGSGLRLNVKTDASNPVEAELRKELNRLDGWGLFAPISVSFQRANSESPTLDLRELRRRHDENRDPADDAVYVVNLETGVPTPLEFGSGSFQYLARDKSLFPATDPRRTEPSVLIETADERADASTGKVDTPLTDYQPLADTDFDGWLDRPNLLSTAECGSAARVQSGELSDVVRDACLADALTPWFEREDDTLVVRPLVPLDPHTTYAVVITDRVVDGEGHAVESPFTRPYHPWHRDIANQLGKILGNAGAEAWFGDMAGTGLDHVVFTWSFTTGSFVDELHAVQRGLNGSGPFAKLAKDYPAQLIAARAVGLVTEEELDQGVSEPDNWEETEDCAPLVARPFVVDAEVASAAIRAASFVELSLESEAARQTVLDSLEQLSHLVLARFRSPFLVAGGPNSRETTGRFRLDVESGTVHTSADLVQAWIFVPKADHSTPPFDVAVYAHGSGASLLEALPWAGNLARQGLATVSYNAPWHGPTAADQALATAIFGACYARGRTAALETRAVDLDGDGETNDDLGGHLASGYVHHGRDVVRQTVVDGMQLVRALAAFDGSLGTQDYNDDGEVDLLGDFDADGVVDVGGPDASYTAWGQSLGGHVATLLGPLEPRVVAVAPLGNWGSLIDGWVHSGSPQTHATFLTPWLGPWVIAVKADELERDTTRCQTDDISLRFEVLLGSERVQTEFGCINVNGLTNAQGLPNGGTAVFTNATTGVRRCARMNPNGTFRVAFPAEVGDKLQLKLFDQPDVVASYAPYDGCEIVAEAEELTRVFTWGAGDIGKGSEDEFGAVLCTADEGCTRFGDHYYPAGEGLSAPAAGAGLQRGSPELRRLLELAYHVTASADAVTYARHYAQDPLPGPSGEPGHVTAALLLAPVGAIEIPVSVQVATARSLGIVPFLAPDTENRRPEWVEYTTPAELYDDLADVTPNRLLIGSSVLEGLPHLERTVPSGGSCAANELSIEEAPECHPTCETTSQCGDSQVCDFNRGNVCRAQLPEPSTCRQALFDVDGLDEEGTRFGEREAPTPLRLARVASPAATAGLDAVWEPRLVGTPRGSDLGAWAADKPTLALFFPYLGPTGRDSLGPFNPCAAFDTDRYVVNLIGRFLATHGLDPYPLSHPSSHRCLASDSCSFLE